MVQIKELQILLDSYVNYINYIIIMFSNILEKENPTRLWRQGLVRRTGYLDKRKQVEYSFHGAGCTVEFENGEIISFDFLEDDTITFDLFKFGSFVLSKLNDTEDVSNLFQQLELYNENGKWKIKKK